MAIALSVMKPGYLAALAGSPMGRAMLLYALVSWGFGLVWLHRMTKLEV
jgi:Flp pilus assembly protein TadB